MSRTPRRPLAAACCALAVGLTTAASGSLAGSEATTASTPEQPIPCLERPIVVVYLHHLQDQAMSYWIIPEDTLTDHVVVVRFRLAEDGSLLTYEPISSTSHRVASSVELAMRRAEPFGQIPWDATCIVGRAIEMRFENPY